MTRQMEELNSKFDRMLENQKSMKATVENLTQTIRKLESGNQNLLKLNKGFEARNNYLADKLKNAETTITTLVDEIETQKQRFLNNTVEILGTSIDKSTNPVGYVQQLGMAVDCTIEEADVANIYIKTLPQRKGPPKSKIIITFTQHKKRMDFYYNCRKFRFSPPANAPAEFRKLNVVDSLTHYKKVIYFEIMEHRKQHPDIIKNVWVNDGDIFIRRFGAHSAETVKNGNFVDTIFNVVPPLPEVEESERDKEEEDSFAEEEGIAGQSIA